MPAWEIKLVWSAKEIGDYRAYVAGQLKRRVGNARCTCEDLAIRLVTDFAEANGLPVAFANQSYPKQNYTRPSPPGAGAGSYAYTKLAFRNGLTPEDFSSKEDFYDKTLTSTAASDVYLNGTTKFLKGASEGNADNLDLARIGDLILLYDGPGHVQVVSAVGNGLVGIMQGNFRPKDERGGVWHNIWNNQNNPNDSKYIGAIVAEKAYTKDDKNNWSFGGKPVSFKDIKGRVMEWDFAAWNSLIVERTVQKDETLSAIALSHWGDGNAWKRIYETNKTKIGGSPDKIRPGMKLLLWK